MIFAERDIMDLYKEKISIDPINDKTHRIFTDEEQIERYAQSRILAESVARV
jgi:hypothetical protein